MKKLFSFVFAVILLLSSVCAYAEHPAEPVATVSPSKTIEDVNTIIVEVENGPEHTGFFVRVEDDEERYRELIEKCQVQVGILGSTTIPHYFAPGHEDAFVQKLADMGVNEPLRVYEFWPVIAGNYIEEYGRVKVWYYAATVYPVGEPVCVMLGFYNNDADNTVEWHMYEGVGEEDGSIRFVVEPEIVTRIQNETALMAIISNDLSK